MEGEFSALASSKIIFHCWSPSTGSSFFLLIVFAWKVWKALTFVGEVAQSNLFGIRQLVNFSMKSHVISETMFSSQVFDFMLI